MRSLLADAIDTALDLVRPRSLRSVAEEAGISAPFLIDLRSDRRGCTDDVARRLAVALGLDPDTLVRYAHERAATQPFIRIGGCPRCKWPYADDR